MFVDEYVQYRGTLVHVSDLKPTSCAKVKVQCPECNKIRSVHYRSIVTAGHHVCMACVMKRRRTFIDPGKTFGMLTVIGSSKKSGYSTCRCICGNVKDIRNWDIVNGQQSCGCKKKENFRKAPIQRGAAHGMWNGGISPERCRTMQTAAYKKWRMDVFDRDNHECQKCKTVHRLQTHHIEEYVNHSGKAIDIQNGITLCAVCHREFHRIYGRKNNNIEQLKEFIG